MNGQIQKSSDGNKKLVPPRFRIPQWQKPKIKSRSILIGTICPEAIVLAADIAFIDFNHVFHFKST
jgi:hypothetical protein